MLYPNQCELIHPINENHSLNASFVAGKVPTLNKIPLLYIDVSNAKSPISY